MPLDSRVAVIEKSLARELTEAQRKAVLENIVELETAWMEGRKSEVADGTEPAFVFTPLAPTGVHHAG